MFRMTFYLLLGIGAAMFFAEEIQGTYQKPARQVASLDAVTTSVLASPDTGTTAVANVHLATFSTDEVRPADGILSATPEPALANATDVRTMMSFMNPVAIEDGKVAVPVVASVSVEAAEPDAPSAADEPLFDVRFVSAQRVNVREGPSTSYLVLDQVLFADAVQVLEEQDNGWVHIRIEGDGIEGYMSGRFLQTHNPYN